MLSSLVASNGCRVILVSGIFTASSSRAVLVTVDGIHTGIETVDCNTLPSTIGGLS